MHRRSGRRWRQGSGWQRSAGIAIALSSYLSLGLPAFSQEPPASTLLADFTPLLSSPNPCAAQLAQSITPIISQRQFATAQWGIVVASLATGEVLYEHNGDRFFIPASNIKLLTTAAALQRLAEAIAQPPSHLSSQIQRINRDSHNPTADQLFRDFGGQTQVQTALSPLGIAPTDFRQVDGSGLSRYNMIRPRALVTLLRSMWFTDRPELFYQSLPVAGVSGTLRSRFVGTPAQGRVRAKTGTLNGVRALSGYLETVDHDSLVFSILLNQPGQSGTVMVAGIDAIVLQLTQARTCGVTNPSDR